MTNDLEARIRDVFRDLANQTAVTPDVLPTAVAGRPRPERSRWAYATAAAATLALVAGGVVVQLNRDDTKTAAPAEYGDPVGISRRATPNAYWRSATRHPPTWPRPISPIASRWATPARRCTSG